MSGSFYVEELGMGESSVWPNLVDNDMEGNFREETQEEIARVKEEINILKREKVIALLRGFLKKCVLEIQKKLLGRETCLGASTSFVFVALLNKQQIVDCDRMNNYGRPELFVSDFSVCAARFGCQRRRESFVC